MEMKLKSKVMAVTLVMLMMVAGLTVLVDSESDATGTPSGDLYGAGSNYSGQQGNGTTTNVTTPTQIGSTLGTITDVVASEETTFFLTSDGKLYGMGRNNFGQQGNGTTTSVTTPTQVGETLGTITKAVCSNSTTFFITSDGKLYGMGLNSAGQQGTDSGTNVTTPTQIGSTLGTITDVACNSRATMFLTSDGKLYFCGSGVKTPTQYGSDLGNITKIACAEFVNYFVTSNGDLYGWGRNTYGQMGDGTTTNVDTPTQIGSTLGTITKVVCDENTMLFLTSEGKLYGTGAGTTGQLGNGGTDSTTPIQVGSTLGTIVDMNCSIIGATTFVTADGKLYGTGYNQSGQMGTGNTTTVTTPVQIGSGLGKVRVAPYPSGAILFIASQSYTATFEPSDNTYGTVSSASVADIEPGTTATISDNTITIGQTTITATASSNNDQYTYAFTGWSVGGSPVTGTYTINADTTFTAEFSRTTNAYNVSLVAGTGGTVTTDTIASVPYGTAVTVSGNTLTFATTPNATVITATPSSTAQYTYSFSEWQKNGVTLSADTTTGTNDVYTAVFSSVLNTYTVTIQSNDITLGTVSPTSVASVPYGTQIAVSGDTLTINGTTVTATPSAATTEHEYSFASWSIQNNYVVEGNVTITATFIEGVAEYTVTIQANDNTYGTVSPTSVANVPYGTSITVSGNTLSINGTTVTATPANANQQYTYGFGSWSVSDNDTVTGATTITATFTATLKTYTITWSINGETETETYDYGQTPAHATPVRAYYDFAGWDPAIATVTGDRTYTATWTPTVYTVTFDGQEGTPAVASATGSVETAVTLPDCTRSEWYFAGWYDSNDTLIGYAGTPYYPTADITLYAEWSDQVIRHYSLVYNANGGDGAPESQFYQSTDPEVSSWTFTISSTVPTSALGDFLGWALTQNASEAEYQPGEEITVEADTSVTLYAVWEESAGHSVLKSILEIVPYLIVIGIILALTATIFMNRMRGDGISELTPVIIQAALAILVVVIILIPFLGMI